MERRMLQYVVVGGAGALLVGLFVTAWSLASRTSTPKRDNSESAARTAREGSDIRTPAVPTRARADYQTNPPEAGLVTAPPARTSGVGKPAAPVAARRTPAKTTWLKPAPVSPKSVRLGRLTSPSILVEKSALRLIVFDGEAGVKSYRIAAGANRGDKEIEGDRKTPEGDFYICIRKTAGQTKYTRSMGLSYPNIEDAARGLRGGLITRAQYRSIVSAIKKRLKPPWQTKLGGAIMIHGKREGRTGTLGCVALDDEDVLELYRRLPLNTPVRIIP